MKDAEHPLWDVTLSHLKQIHPGLWFEISDLVDGAREFVITAEGNSELFSLVDMMVATSSPLCGWRFVALKQASGFEFTTEYEGLRLDPSAIWFLPMDIRDDPSAVGLRFGIPNLRHEQQRQAENGVLVMLDTAMGERESAAAFQRFEVAPLPAEPEKEGYIELRNLPAYIMWRRKRMGN